MKESLNHSLNSFIQNNDLALCAFAVAQHVFYFICNYFHCRDKYGQSDWKFLHVKMYDINTLFIELL